MPRSDVLAIRHNSSINNRRAAVRALALSAPLSLPLVLVREGLIERGLALRREQIADIVGDGAEALELGQETGDLALFRGRWRDAGRWRLHVRVDDLEVAGDLGVEGREARAILGGGGGRRCCWVLDLLDPYTCRLRIGWVLHHVRMDVVDACLVVEAVDGQFGVEAAISDGLVDTLSRIV